MNLLALRTEVFGHGFDQTQFPISRVNQYLNDAYRLIVRRVDYFLDEESGVYSTAAGSAFLPGPADLARVGSVYDADRRLVLQEVTTTQFDASPLTQGAPFAYTLSGGRAGIFLRLYPTPDGVYTIVLRYWGFPPLLVNDTDVPQLPDGWHHLLWRYAVAECFKSEDDLPTGAQWTQDFNTNLSMFAADVKFPGSEAALQAQSMWESEARPLGPSWG